MARQQRQFPQGKYILRTPRKSQNGQVYAVYLYYYWQGKQVRRSVDLTVALKDWNQDANGGAGEFRPSYGPNYKERNAYLKELMHDIDSKIMDYIKLHGEIDGDTIEAFVSGDDKALRTDNGIDFIEFAKQRFIDRYNSGKIGVSSRENGISYINQFAKFLKQEKRGSHGANNELLYLGEITEQLVLDFQNWQLGNDRKVDTVNKVVQAIGGVCTYASQMRYVPIEVTLAIKDLHLSDKSLDADDVSVKYLTKEQLKEFAGIRETLPHIRMKVFHDMFMFSFYACGLRLIDMMTLRWVDIDFKKQVIRNNDISRADIPYIEENEEKENISVGSCCRYIPLLFLKEAERSKKIHSKFEELKKRRKEDWKNVPELIEDLNKNEYSEKDFESFLELPYRFYRNDFIEWLNGYNAKIKNS